MRSRHTYDEDDMFADTRMSFGDHIEELRRHLWRAIYGILFFMFVGFILDQIGDWINMPYLGIGRPVMNIISEPVKAALVDFYETRYKRLKDQAKKDGDAKNALEAKPMTIIFDRAEWAKLAVKRPEEMPADQIEIAAKVPPDQIYEMNRAIDNQVRPKELTTLSAQESLFVYFKVTMISGLVLASPWVFWQIWSFIAKGLYPNEKRWVYLAIGPSTALFVLGILVCQFLVMPQTVKGLLWFNDFLGFTPDLRLNEWLGLAIMLPVIFGVSFETPLVMIALQRFGIMSADDFKKKRKYAWFGMAVFAMIITPTADALTMLYLWVPLVLLYESGIWVCRFFPGGIREEEPDEDVPQSEELIEV